MSNLMRKTPFKFACLAITAFALTACEAGSTAIEPARSTVFADRWFGGLERDEPELQVQAYDPDTLVIRQSLRTTFEAPFMYLLFGDDKALLIDTGVDGVDLRGEIDARLRARLTDKNSDALQLIVMHTHGHGDHVGNDGAFETRPDTVVVGHAPEAVADFFGLADWPETPGSVDLGGRVVDIIPTPGHHDSHVAVYDRRTQLLITGDMIYPGRLYFRCDKVAEFQRSISRLVEFASTRNVSWVMGGHIELATVPGKSFGSHDRKRRDERQLELPPSIIYDVQAAVANMNDVPHIEPHGDFILFPHPADPRGKKPPNWCLGEMANAAVR